MRDPWQCGCGNREPCFALLEALQSSFLELGEALPLYQQDIEIEAGAELTGVELGGRAQVLHLLGELRGGGRATQGLLKLSHIHRVTVGKPHREPVGHQDTPRSNPLRLQRFTEGGQGLLEAVASLLHVDIGPEQVYQLLTGALPTGSQREESQEPTRLAALEVVEHVAVPVGADGS